MFPESDKIRPRPVFARYCQRLLCEEWGVPLSEPTYEEICDAFLALSEASVGPLADPVHDEAIRIIMESQP